MFWPAGVLFPIASSTLFAQGTLPAKPPVAPVRPVTTDYYGTKVVDPYRYMENLKDPQVQAWMKAQNDYTRAVLARIPGREHLLEQIRKFGNAIAPVQVTRLPGDRYLILKELPGENAANLYLRQGLGGQDRLLVNPTKIKLAPADEGKGSKVISYFSVSQDGKYLAVGVMPGGDEPDTEIHVIATVTGRETGDVIPHAPNLMGSPSWLPDGRSFVYSRIPQLPPGAPAAEIEQKFRSYLHVLGSDPTKDPAVFGYGVVPNIQVDPSYFAGVAVLPGSAYAVGEISNGVPPDLAFYIEPLADLGKTDTAWRKVADLSDDVTEVAEHGHEIYLLTYKNALRYKVLRTDAGHPDLATAEIVVPPSQAVVTGIHAADDALYVNLLDGGINRVLHVSYGSKPEREKVQLPFKGIVENVVTDLRLPGAVLRMASWTGKYGIYAYDPKTNRVTDTKLQPVAPHSNPTNLESVEVKARSYDGTMIPLSIVYPKGIKLDSSNPTILSGYGAYGMSLEPGQEPGMGDVWNEMGGVGAVCHVRGGGAYGEAWHLAGKGSTKPNTWQDFIACAEYLIQHKYTSPAHLAGFGASAGGILIGRAITSRPDLFAAAVDVSGMSDTLRYETTANGPANIPEFGSVKTKAGFEALYAMSPYAHIKKGTAYPAVLLTTGMNDPRVNPWQADKMTARLQAATSSGRPILMRVNYSGGHGIMGATKRQFEELQLDVQSFLLWQLGAPGFQPKN